MTNKEIERLKQIVDDLEIQINIIKEGLLASYTALYKACADLLSVNYPKNGEDVDELVKKYLNDDE